MVQERQKADIIKWGKEAQEADDTGLLGLLVAEKGEYMSNEKVLITADTHGAQEPLRDDSEM